MNNLRFIIISVSILVSLAGCQTGQSGKTAPIDNGSFMGLWRTYSDCQASTNLEELRQNALTLTNAINRSFTPNSFVLPLPGKLEKFVSTPSARLAVDVKAMAAACSLRASYAAVEAGKLDIAKGFLQTILSSYPQSEYAYYSLQAKTLLSELETKVIEVTLNLP